MKITGNGVNYPVSDFAGNLRTSSLRLFNSYAAKQSFIEQVTNLTPSLIAVYNLQTGQYVFINKSLKPLLGYEREEWLNKGIKFVISKVHPDDLPRLMEENQKALEADKARKDTLNNPIIAFEYRLKHADGGYRWLKTYGSLFDRDKKGQVKHVINISLDITAIKESEEKLRRFSKELEGKVEIRTKKLNENLKKSHQSHLEQLRNNALRLDIHEALSKKMDLNKSLLACVRALVDRLDMALAKIWVVEEKTQALKLLVSSSQLKSKLKQTEPQWVKSKDGWITLEKKPYLTNDPLADAQIRDKAWIRENNIESFAGYPLVLRNKLIGILSLYSKQKISHNTHQALHSVADTIAQGLGRIQAEEALAASERKYHTIFSTLTEGVVLQDNQGKILAANSSAERILKINYNEMKKHSVDKTKRSAYIGENGSNFDESNFPFLQAFKTGTPQKNKIMGIIKNNHTIWISTNSIPLRDENNRIYAVASSFQDITAQKEQAKQKDEFISIASHELKTPLTTIKSFNEILKLQLTDHEKGQYYLGKMDKEIDRLTQLVNELLDVSKISSGHLTLKKSKTRIGNFMKEVVEDLQPVTLQHKIILKNIIDMEIIMDKYRIYQVLMNLISNAIKYSPKSDKVFISTNFKDSKVFFTVRDFGIGITKKDKKKIFDPFFQASSTIRQSHSGLGLGLHIAREIVTRHGGKIAVKSVKGVGSTFSFYLPTD